MDTQEIQVRLGLEVDEEQATVVRRIFEMYVNEGLSISW